MHGTQEKHKRIEAADTGALRKVDKERDVRVPLD